jgi:hypothetical protein
LTGAAEIHKTLIEVVVLSEGPLPDTIEDGNWLRWVAQEIEDGASIGDWRIVSDQIVSPEKLEPELFAIGNDGSFFELDE